MKSRLAVSLAALLVPAAGWAFDYPVAFATTDCNGDTGFINVDASLVYRIQTTTCDAGHTLKQALLRRTAGEGYDVVTLTADEAEMLRAELRAYTAARRKVLEGGNAVIVTD